jgi:hypothetical protein
MSQAASLELADDLLVGAAAIAIFLFGDAKYRRRVFYLAEKKRLPIFRLHSQLCARKSTLIKWIEDQENRHFFENSRGDRVA